MAVEIAPADRVRLSPISWPALFASLAVGISVMLLLTLAGIAFGLTAVDPTAETTRAITIGAATGWLSATVLLSLVLSMIGGAMGSRGTRRINRRFARHTVAPPPTTAAPEGPASVLSRQN